LFNLEEVYLNFEEVRRKVEKFLKFFSHMILVQETRRTLYYNLYNNYVNM